jgi:hypothetical protein
MQPRVAAEKAVKNPCSVEVYPRRNSMPINGIAAGLITKTSTAEHVGEDIFKI